MKKNHITETDTAPEHGRRGRNGPLRDARVVGQPSHGATPCEGAIRVLGPEGEGRFDIRPSRYSRWPASASVAGEAGPGTTVYTCPMHPEVRQDGPGKCPKCGMFLQPLASGSQMRRRAAATCSVQATPAPLRYSAGYGCA